MQVQIYGHFTNSRLILFLISGCIFRMFQTDFVSQSDK